MSLLPKVVPFCLKCAPKILVGIPDVKFDFAALGTLHSSSHMFRNPPMLTQALTQKIAGSESRWVPVDVLLQGLDGRGHWSRLIHCKNRKVRKLLRSSGALFVGIIVRTVSI